MYFFLIIVSLYNDYKLQITMCITNLILHDMKKQKRLLGGGLILIALLLMTASASFADIVIKTGSTIKVSSGTNVVVSSNVLLDEGGTIDNSGVVTVKGDFTNDGTTSLGSGEFIFDGTAPQSIGGSEISEFGDLTVNNSSGVSLGNDIVVEGGLTLTDGLFTIGVNNFIFGTAAGAVAGTPSGSNMIVADNTGEVRKVFPDGSSLDPAAFLFPIGSDGGTPEYSPVTLDFNSSTFAVDAHAGVIVKTIKEPNNSSSTNYLERYWTLTQLGISAYTYDLIAEYVPLDVIGTEADMSGALYDGAGWLILDPVNAGNHTFSGADLDRTGNITGVEFRILLSDFKVVVQGAYSSVTDEMTTKLNSDGIIPLTAAAAYAHIGYTGTESVGAIPSADIVDWILVEVRDATSAATAITAGDTAAGFLMNDGTMVGIDGVSPIPFKTLIANDAYFVIIHRNHLPVMTANAPAKSFGNYVYDFTDLNTKAYGTNAMYQVDTAPVIFGLYGGETNLSGIISNADKVPVDINIGLVGYDIGDCNFSGIISNADKVYIDLHIGEVSQVPK